MKNVKAILTAALVVAGLGSTAKAISLGALIGDPSYTGQLVFKYSNYDEGQLYDVSNVPLNVSTPVVGSGVTQTPPALAGTPSRTLTRSIRDLSPVIRGAFLKWQPSTR